MTAEQLHASGQSSVRQSQVALAKKKGKGNLTKKPSKAQLNDDFPSPIKADLQTKAFGGSNEADVTIYRKPEDDIEVSGAVLPEVTRLDTASAGSAQRAAQMPDPEQEKQHIVQRTDQGLMRIVSETNSENNEKVNGNEEENV